MAEGIPAPNVTFDDHYNDLSDVGADHYDVTVTHIDVTKTRADLFIENLAKASLITELDCTATNVVGADYSSIFHIARVMYLDPDTHEWKFMDYVNY